MTAESKLRLVEQEYRLAEQIGFLLRKANQRHVAIFAGQIGDLTPPQFAAMAKLAEIGETSQNQLGQFVAMDSATIKGVIDRLRARDYVELQPHGEDRRRVIVRLTARGRETIEALLPVGHEISEETLAPLNARESDMLLKLLARIA
jgi:MarR family transcriptional regulator, lower aerobic nicotinate degradation pathway regulator